MPWKIEKRGDQFCVMKEDSNESEGCHDSRDEAMSQMRALYASEEKALKESQAAAIKAAELIDKPPSWLDFYVDKVTNAVKSLLHVGQGGDRPEMLLIKEAGGTFQVVTRYSNKFRDNDHPAEIIASTSHQKFASLVAEGVVKPPDLWLWHMPEWKIGEGLWAAYDDSGFALAGHRVSKENAELLMALKGDVRVSHGMPKWSVRRAQDDPTVIEEHITTEVSLLPGWAAANKMTSAVILEESKENNDMAISKEQRAKLMQEHGITAEQLDRLEAQNKDDAQLATSAGVENKEQGTTPAAPATPDSTPAAPASPAEVKATDFSEVTKALEDTMAVVLKLSETVNGLRAEVKELKVADEAKVAEKAANTPLASLSDLLRKSVAESPETLVDGRTSLAKSGPPQAKDTNKAGQTPTGIPWIDGLLAGAPANEGGN